MDMNTPVSPLILHAFYRTAAVELVVVLIIALLLWVFTKRSSFIRQLFTSHTEDSRQDLGFARRELRIRHILTIVFGIIWIVDGVLQLQPQMSTKFISGMEAPLISGLPGFLPRLLSPLLYIWTLHPLFFDTLAAWFQLLLGIVLLFGPTRRIGRIGLYVSVGWAFVVWVVGEGFGIFGGATWLTGAPGAVLLYGLAAVLALHPLSQWKDGRVKKRLTASIGVMWIVCAVLQALPSAGFWQAGGLQGAESDMAGMSQPSWMAAPLNAAATAFNHLPAVWNAAFVIILATLGVLWCLKPNARFLSDFSMLFTFLTWWIGQDFGVVGGMGTDLNTGGPLLVLLLTARSLRSQQEVSVQSENRAVTRKSISKPLYASVGTAVVVLALGSTMGASAAVRNSDSAVQTEVDQAALTPVHKPLPNLTLTDQNGKKVSLASFRGKAVVLTFLDPVCYDECPVIAQEMKQADKLLGPYADKVQMVGIAADPLFHSVKDVQRFDKEEGLSSMKNWTFLTSNNSPVLQDAWKQLYEYVSVPRLGMVVHAFNMYFISPSGQEVWLANAQGDTNGSAAFSAFVAKYAEKLLGVTAPINGESNIHPTAANSGLVHPSGFDSIQMTSQSTGWATAFVKPYQQILHTTDGGKTWKDVTLYGITQRGGILLAPVSNSTAWGLVPQVGDLKYSALFKTTDGGIHWSHVGYAGPTPKMYGSSGLSVTPDGSVLWLTGKSNSSGTVYLYRSTNHAATWQPVKLNLDVSGQSTTTEPIKWTSATDGMLTVKVNQGTKETVLTFRTQDKGKTWTEVPSHQTFNTSAFVGNPVVEGSATGTQAVWKVVAGAGTSSPSVVKAGTRFVDVLDNSHMWSIRTVGNHTEVFQSSDEGKTWTEVFSDSHLSPDAAPIS